MTRLQFVDGFWDKDFLGNRGFEILCQRLKCGKKMCKEIDEYIKERIKAEQVYSKTLLSAVKKLTIFEDMGDLGRAVLQLQRETDKTLCVHELAAKQLFGLQRELSEFINEQNNRRHIAEDTMRKSNNLKQQAYNKAMASKEKYIQRCREKDNIEDTFYNAKQSVTVKSKELEKIEKNKERATEALENADQAYRNSINILAQTKDEWERQMEKTCHTFENLEEGRVEMIRDLIWKSTNIDSQACVDHDQCDENVRQKLELCDIDKDLKEFIDKNKTGSERPAFPSQVLYENYYRKKDNTKQEKIYEKSSHGRPPARPMPFVRKRSTEERSPAQTGPTEQGQAGFIQPDRYNVAKDESLISLEEDNGVPGTECGYSSVDINEMRTDRVRCQIQRPYTSKNVSEHSVEVGEVVEIVRQMPETAMIQIMKNGRIGVIPKVCVQMTGYV